MAERDWEFDFEGFDWESHAADDAEGFEKPSADDDAFAELFGQLDDVRVDDGLQRQTLETIYSATEDASLSSVRPRWRGRRTRKRHPVRLRLAIVAACLVVALVGAASWFVPVTSIAVVQDDCAVTLGVNVYGVTVASTASDELGKQVLDTADPHNQGFGNAITKVLDAYERLRPDGNAGLVSVDVSSPMGFENEGLRTEATKIVDGRMRTQNEDAHAESSAQSPAQDGEQTPTTPVGDAYGGHQPTDGGQGFMPTESAPSQRETPNQEESQSQQQPQPSEQAPSQETSGGAQHGDAGGGFEIAPQSEQGSVPAPAQDGSHEAPNMGGFESGGRY